MARHFSTLVELVQNSVSDFADKDFLGTKAIDGTWSWTSYQEFGDQVDRARAGLKLKGLAHGERIAIIADNRVEWAVIAFAAYGLGACVVPMYQAQKTEEWEFILNDCSAKVVACATKEIFETLKGHQSKLNSVEVLIGLDLPADHPSSYANLLKMGKAQPVECAEVAPSDLATFIYTSGTTGNPKGVKLSHQNFASNTLAGGQRFDFGPGDMSLAFLPWAHSFGQTAEVYTLCYYGAAMAINDEIPNLVENLAVVKPTVLVAVPRIFNRIYDGVNKQIAGKPKLIQKLFRSAIATATAAEQGETVSLSARIGHQLADRLIFSKIRLKFGGKLRFVCSGSAALSTEVAQFIHALGIDVYEGYGLTETSPIVTANYPGHRKVGSVGLPLPGVEVEIDTSVTNDKLNGEIVVRGPNVMQGYHNRDEENAAVLPGDGSFRTGDMGRFDEEGFLFITGRIKEQYKLENGKYVVPSPLEEELKLSPFVANIMLHGVNQPYNVALVVPDPISLAEWAEREGVTLGDVEKNPQVVEMLMAELEKFGGSLKGYERPRKIAVVSEDFTIENDLLTPTMKLKRRMVMQRYGSLVESLYQGKGS